MKVGKREAGVDDVLDHDDVLAVQRGVEILVKADVAGAGRGRAVARDDHEIEGGLALDRACEIRDEHERALQHGHQMEPLGHVAPDLGRHLGDARLNLRGGEQNRCGLKVFHAER